MTAPNGELGVLRLWDNSLMIWDACRSPMRALEVQVGIVLEYIDPADLPGLAAIHLVDKADPPSATSSARYTKAFNQGLPIQGWWGRFTEESFVAVLNIPAVLRGLPRPLWRTPAATMRIGAVLSHEIGHHVLFMTGASSDDIKHEETAADAYRDRVLAKMRTQLKYRLGDRMNKHLADNHWVFGVACWRDGEFRRAASHWLTAWTLDNDCEAKNWYWDAVEKAKASENSRSAPFK